MKSSFFVGFTTLEEWLDALEPDKPVLATPIVEPGGDGGGGLTIDELLVLCQQITSDGHVYYCRLRAASLTRCHGEPFDPDWRAREAAWHSLRDCVFSVLKERGLAPKKATVARPRELVFLEGRSRQIAYNRDLKRYERKEVSDVRDA